MTAATDSEARIVPGEAQFCSRCGCPDCQQRRQDEAIKTALTTDAQARCWSCSCGWIGCYTRAELAEHGEPTECQKCYRERLEECDPPRRLAATPTVSPADLEAESRELLDAARWRALLGCARIRCLGAANVGDDGSIQDPSGWVHFGAEFWSIYPGYETRTYDQRERAAQVITALADHVIATNPERALSARQIAQGVERLREVPACICGDPKNGHYENCPTLRHPFNPDGSPKIAPVQGWTPGIPWSLHLEAYDAYRARWSAQAAMIDLEKRGCRGGFSVRELDGFIPGWRDRASEIASLKAEIERLKATRLSGGEVERLREALEPFAKALGDIAGPDKTRWPDHETIEHSGAAELITWGDLRRARAAIQGESRD